MIILRVFLIVAWAAVLFVSIQAVGSQGLSAGGDVFFADMVSGTWHAQFSVDFLGYLLLIASWVMWRHKFSLAGIALGLLCFMGGGFFSFIYLLVASILAKGNPRVLLLGKHETVN